MSEAEELELLELEEQEAKAKATPPGRDPKSTYLQPESDLVTESPEPEPRSNSAEAGALHYVHGFMKGGADEAVGHVDAMADQISQFAQKLGLSDPPKPQPYSPVPPMVTHKVRYVDPKAQVQARRVPGTGGSGVPVESGIRVKPQVQLQPDEPVQPSYVDTYRKGRGSVRDLLNSTAKEHPDATGKADFLGDLTSEMMLAAGTGGASLSPVGQTASGAFAGLMRSDADLTRPNSTPKGNLLTNDDRALLDTTGGAALGFVGGKAGQQFSRLSGYLGGKVRQAVSDAGEKVAMGGMKQLRSALGAAGGESSAARKILDGLQEILSSPHSTPEQKADAAAKLASPEAAELARGVFDSYLQRFTGTMGKLNSAGELVKQAEGKLLPEALDQATEEALKNPIRRQVLPRVGNYVARTAPTLIGGALGAAVGGDDDKLLGAGVGGAVGGITGAALGNPGTALKNMMNNPAFRKFAWGTAEKAIKLGGATLGKYGPVLAREYLTSPDSALAMHEALLLEDPEYGEQFVQGAGGSPW